MIREKKINKIDCTRIHHKSLSEYFSLKFSQVNRNDLEVETGNNQSKPEKE